MNDDPLTDHLQMRAIHHFRFAWLFNDNGKPQVLYRRRHTKRHKDGKVTNELDVEWGNLESSFLDDASRTALCDAWHQYLDWSKANA